MFSQKQYQKPQFSFQNNFARYLMEPEEEEFFLKHNLECLDVIAVGGYGIIYLVYSHLYKTKFAMKMITKEDFKPIEIQCLMSIDDPHIIRLYQHFKFNDSIYLLMEYCPTDLEKMLINSKSISHDDMMRYIQDVILCVRACHQHNIAHCDIKPGNFLIDSYGRIKITDFGMSIIHKQSQNYKSYRGTRLCMAPEIMKKQEYNPIKADIWALGVTIYFMATKRYPFSADCIEEKIIQCRYDESLVSDPLLRQVIQSCLNVDPELRFSEDQLLSLPYFQSNIDEKGENKSIRISKTRTNLKMIIKTPYRGTLKRYAAKSFVVNSKQDCLSLSNKRIISKI